MSPVIFDKEKCIGCSICVNDCPDEPVVSVTEIDRDILLKEWIDSARLILSVIQ